MPYGAERRRLRGVIESGEAILGSDLLSKIKELPNLSRPPVLVVTNRAIYVLTSGRGKGILGIPFDNLTGVNRKSTLLPREWRRQVAGRSPHVGQGE
jgi:hypothetical protein